MSAPDEWRLRAGALPPGHTATFRLACGGRILPGFVVNHAGAIRAYLNRCPHAGTTLDVWPNEFFSADGRWLVCATHGAVFDPATGACTAGPCAGDALAPLPVRVAADGSLVIACP